VGVLHSKGAQRGPPISHCKIRNSRPPCILKVAVSALLVVFGLLKLPPLQPLLLKRPPLKGCLVQVGLSDLVIEVDQQVLLARTAKALPSLVWYGVSKKPLQRMSYTQLIPCILTITTSMKWWPILAKLRHLILIFPPGRRGSCNKIKPRWDLKVRNERVTCRVVRRIICHEIGDFIRKSPIVSVSLCKHMIIIGVSVLLWRWNAMVYCTLLDFHRRRYVYMGYDKSVGGVGVRRFFCGPCWLHSLGSGEESIYSSLDTPIKLPRQYYPCTRCNCVRYVATWLLISVWICYL